MNETNDFSTGKLFPIILRYSIPAAISLLITAIYNIVDRIFVGNFNGTSALAGLSICFPLSYMMMAFGLTCSAGGSSLFSLFAGKGEQKNMNRSFGNALILVVIFEVLLSALLLIFANSILKVFGVTETAYEYAFEYYRIVALGCLFQGLTQVFCDFVRVSGKPVSGYVCYRYRRSNKHCSRRCFCGSFGLGCYRRGMGDCDRTNSFRTIWHIPRFERLHKSRN
ncbi:MAG: MATE family efflux transporter [Enterocloster sp.]